MTHKLYLDWMQLALDDELPEARRLELDAHLGACAECAGKWEALRQVGYLFAAAPHAAPRRGFSTRFQARLAQQRARPHAFWGALALGLGAVGAAALVVPLGVTVLWSAVQVVGQPAVSAAFFSGVNATTNVLATLAGALFVAGRALANTALPNPWVWAAALAALSLTLLWAVLFRRWALQGLRL
jgi:anti-sigma factor RsiW